MMMLRLRMNSDVRRFCDNIQCMGHSMRCIVIFSYNNRKSGEIDSHIFKKNVCVLAGVHHKTNNVFN